MFADNLLMGMAGFTGVFYALLAPLMLSQFLGLLFIPALLQAGAKPRAVAEALYCYFMAAFGVLLMTIGALPTLWSVLAGMPYNGDMYFALLLLFAMGGGIFLWQEQHSRSLDPVAKSVPSAIFFYIFKIIGQLTVALSTLSLALSMLTETTQSGWWVMPLVLILYGGFLTWTTRSQRRSGSGFKIVSMAPSAPMMRFGRPVPAMLSKNSIAKKMKAKKRK